MRASSAMSRGAWPQGERRRPEAAVPPISSPAMAELPEQRPIREVGPRDGFQNEPETIDTAEKVRLIDMLSARGWSGWRSPRSSAPM